MPHMTVEYSACLHDFILRQYFAKAVHERISQEINSPISHFKTRFYALDDVVIGGDVVFGDDSSQTAMIHVDFRLLSGRSEEKRRLLGERILMILRGCVNRTSGYPIVMTVEVSEIDRKNYHKHEFTASGNDVSYD